MVVVENSLHQSGDPSNATQKGAVRFLVNLLFSLSGTTWNGVQPREAHQWRRHIIPGFDLSFQIIQTP